MSRCHQPPRACRRTLQTRRERSRPGSTRMRKRWPVVLAKSCRLYERRIAIRLNPDILCVMWRSDGPRFMQLAPERVDALRVKVDRRLRAAGLLQ